MGHNGRMLGDALHFTIILQKHARVRSGTQWYVKVQEGTHLMLNGHNGRTLGDALHCAIIFHRHARVHYGMQWYLF